MQYLYGFLILLSLICAVCNGTPETVTASVLQSGAKAVEYALTTGAAIMTFGGLMRILDRAGLTALLSRLLSPLIRALFGRVDAEAKEAISMNVACNVLGLGNAATPYGIRAMRAMAAGETASNAMIRLVVINSCSVQLLPVTLAAVRQNAGSRSPLDILPCIWLCSALSLAAGLAACIICERTGTFVAKLRHSHADRHRRRRGDAAKS